jgi:hypothetical protein
MEDDTLIPLSFFGKIPDNIKLKSVFNSIQVDYKQQALCCKGLQLSDVNFSDFLDDLELCVHLVYLKRVYLDHNSLKASNVVEFLASREKLSVFTDFTISDNDFTVCELLHTLSKVSVRRQVSLFIETDEERVHLLSDAKSMDTVRIRCKKDAILGKMLNALKNIPNMKHLYLHDVDKCGDYKIQFFNDVEMFEKHYSKITDLLLRKSKIEQHHVSMFHHFRSIFINDSFMDKEMMDFLMRSCATNFALRYLSFYNVWFSDRMCFSFLNNLFSMRKPKIQHLYLGRVHLGTNPRYGYDIPKELCSDLCKTIASNYSLLTFRHDESFCCDSELENNMKRNLQKNQTRRDQEISLCCLIIHNHAKIGLLKDIVVIIAKIYAQTTDFSNEIVV